MGQKSKKKPITITRKKLNEIKMELTGDAVDRALLLILTAAKDEGINDDKLFAIIDRSNRYADYIEENLAKMHDMQRILKEKYGLTVKGF